MLESIAGYIFIAILILLLFLSFLFLLIYSISEHSDDIELYVIVLIGLFFSVFLSIKLFYQFSYTFNPPEVIEVDGYSYQLSDDEPDEIIEKNGHKYILIDEG